MLPRWGFPSSVQLDRTRSFFEKIHDMSEDHDLSHIEKYRGEIDRIDTELLKMLNRRAECALSIGKIKKRNNLPVFVPEREQEVLRKLGAENSGPFTEDSVRKVFQEIFAQMKALEEALEPSGSCEG